MAAFKVAHGAASFLSVLYSSISAASQEVSVNGVIILHGCLVSTVISVANQAQVLTLLMATALHATSAVSLAVATH